jgi:hypothetical protein
MMKRGNEDIGEVGERLLRELLGKRLASISGTAFLLEGPVVCAL